MSSKVFVTGASGFLGTEIILTFARRGYQIRGTTRKSSSADAFKSLYPEWANSVEFVLVQDGSDQEALKKAMEGCSVLAHLASPWHLTAKTPEEYTEPAVNMALATLKAAAATPTIKHVVLTSSFAALLDLSQGTRPGYTYSEKDWNPADLAACKKFENNPAFWYCASKGMAESAAWKFWEENAKEKYTLTTFCPPMIMGPPGQPISSMNKLNESIGEFWQVMDGSHKEIPPTGFPVFVDVRDVALAHVLAVEKSNIASGKRYPLVAGHYSLNQIAYILQTKFPERKHLITPTDNAPPPPHYDTDSTLAEKDFGLKWIGLEECTVDTAKKLLEVEKKLQQ